MVISPFLWLAATALAAPQPSWQTRLAGLQDEIAAVHAAEAAVDRYDTAQLKKLLAAYDWFTIDEFGQQADEDGWLLVQHADLDHAFQKEVLGRLERLYPDGRTSKRNYAFLYDRVAIAEGRPQLYGTQGDCRDSVWTPYPSEQPQRLDERRAAMGLESVAERQATLSPQYCR